MSDLTPRSRGREVAVRALLRGASGFERFARLAQQRGLLPAWHAFRQERTLAALRTWCEAKGLRLAA